MQFFSDQTLFNQKSNSNIHVILPPSPCRLVIVLPCLLFVSSLNANIWSCLKADRLQSYTKHVLPFRKQPFVTFIVDGVLYTYNNISQSSGEVQVEFGSSSGWGSGWVWGRHIWFESNLVNFLFPKLLKTFLSSPEWALSDSTME